MGFGFIMTIRILFGVCMVFIIGYIFGGFAKNPALVSLTKVAAILAIVLFVSANVFFMRLVFRHGADGEQGGPGTGKPKWQQCRYK
ncbi:hypothetical protein [Pedobacter africanus]|uniref:Uncharacterized protein n=1 Tax=Pedobacter africanus TaxID=151894 RepID=A0A1W2DA28_9SPHI|nr:hypothetical protein [Pedobacter africanus]SMC94349.1 hypothetical protein SAMN04488524_3532 [Pedobacter africanus]